LGGGVQKGRATGQVAFLSKVDSMAGAISPFPAPGFDPARRAALRFGMGAFASFLAAPAFAQSFATTAIQQTLGDGQKFSPSLVIDLARLLSKRPYTPPPTDLPDPLNNLNYENYIGIRAQPAGQIWSGENRPFVVEPLHRGYAFQAQVTLFVVEDAMVRRIVYDRSKFDYGRLQPPATLPDLGFSGFRVLGDAQDGKMREVGIFQGATFFRSSARYQNLGVMARGLTLKAGDSKGEEFPAFRAFWIEQPAQASDNLVVHALLDSESVTGAYRFILRASDVSIIDTEITLFARTPVENFGIAGMTSTYFFGPNTRRNNDDPRPAVFESSGLSIHNGNKEWIYRPLNNPDMLQISSFVDPSPKGFGLVQRLRDFRDFRDGDQNFERRPSLWIEPIGEWGQGMVQLIEIPTENEINDNVISYWRPKQGLQPGTETFFAYRQFWSWQPPDRPDLGVVTETRTGSAGGRRRRFMVDFVGEAFKQPQSLAEMKPVLGASPGQVSGLRVWTYPEQKLVRVGFVLDPGGENASELRLLLESNGRPLTETWLYRWTP
jgi:glucans biosynthesis protein